MTSPGLGGGERGGPRIAGLEPLIFTVMTVSYNALYGNRTIKRALMTKCKKRGTFRLISTCIIPRGGCFFYGKFVIIFVVLCKITVVIDDPVVFLIIAVEGEVN